jgi:hypothetical protein
MGKEMDEGMFVYFARFVSEFKDMKEIVNSHFSRFRGRERKVGIQPLTQLFDVLKFSAFLQGSDEGERKDFVRKSHFFIYRR